MSQALAEAQAQAQQAPHAEAPPAMPPMPPAVAPQPTYPRRSPMLAAFLSILPGFGNVYNGLFQRGLVIFLFFFGMMFIVQESRNEALLPLLAPAMVFTFLFGIVDAYRNATLINLGLSEVDLKNQIPDLNAPNGGLAVGVTLFLIGLYGLVTEGLGLDISAIFDFWYVILMAFGGWVAFHAHRSKKAQTEEPTDYQHYSEE